MGRTIAGRHYKPKEKGDPGGGRLSARAPAVDFKTGMRLKKKTHKRVRLDVARGEKGGKVKVLRGTRPVNLRSE